ncbi:MAG: heavy-metal-associated domain-containing protein [Chloroflexi bacterium]|nr:heavy-metal-associated domain-containing protein [Chloroflexota bacterium]
MDTLELMVAGNAIHCSGCESRIQGALAKLPGVQKVKASRKTQKIVLALDQEKTPLRDVLAKLEFLGYTVAPKLGPSSG